MGGRDPVPPDPIGPPKFRPNRLTSPDGRQIVRPLQISKKCGLTAFLGATVAGETILIVEDNPLNLELISDILEAKGYVITTAVNGADALKLVDVETPDLILMDIQLPGLDGLTVMGMIKEKPGFDRVPIIVLTAHAMREMKKRHARPVVTATSANLSTHDLSQTRSGSSSTRSGKSK